MRKSKQSQTKLTWKILNYFNLGCNSTNLTGHAERNTCRDMLYLYYGKYDIHSEVWTKKVLKCVGNVEKLYYKHSGKTPGRAMKPLNSFDLNSTHSVCFSFFLSAVAIVLSQSDTCEANHLYLLDLFFFFFNWILVVFKRFEIAAISNPIQLSPQCAANGWAPKGCNTQCQHIWHLACVLPSSPARLLALRP